MLRLVLALLLATSGLAPAWAETGDTLPVLPTPAWLPPSEASPTPGGPSPWAAGAASAVLPGAGQWWNGRPIRGTLIPLLVLWLYGDAWQRTYSTLPEQRREYREVRDRAASFRADLESRGDTSATSIARRDELLDSAQDLLGRIRISEDYRNSEFAWALGVHAWAVVDAAETAWKDRGGRRPERPMTGAMWRSALLPGLGQVWNGRPSKAALLWMGIGGAVTSAWSRQQVVSFWMDQKEKALADGRETAASEASDNADFFRKRRNQYYWGLGLIYVYQILDAGVDAKLSRLDRPFGLALSPHPDGTGLDVAWTF